MVTPEVWPAYQEHYRMGQALYIDQYYGLRQEKVLGDFMLPDEQPKWLEHNTYYALYTADQYVWCYSERMNWWKNEVPAGCEDAVRDARAHVNAGQRLGFSLEPIVAAAQERRNQAQQAARYPRLARRIADIPRLPAGTAPVIDGDPGEALWQAVPRLDPFVLLGTSNVPQGKTTAWAAYDSKAIYIAFRCDAPPGTTQSEHLADNDIAIFRGDVAEVFLNVTRSDSMFFHFAINPRNSFWSGHHVKDKPEPLGQGCEHAAKIQQNGWSAEIAVPWSILGLSGPPAPPAPSQPDIYTPRPAPPIRVNLARYWPKGNEYSSWAPISKSFLEPGNFGTWRFK
jgi:hypothetical protein